MMAPRWHTKLGKLEVALPDKAKGVLKRAIDGGVGKLPRAKVTIPPHRETSVAGFSYLRSSEGIQS
jgi:hypothetical protein